VNRRTLEGSCSMSSEFEPKIVAFLCNWCSYRGADLAGTSRFKHPSNLRVVRVMCSGSEAKYFMFVEDQMFSKRESKMLQHHIIEHGKMPKTNQEMEDLS